MRCLPALAALCIFFLAMLAMSANAAPALNLSASSSTAGSYDSSFAELMVRYSSAAYCPDTSLSSWNCTRCGGQIKGFHVAEVFEDTARNIQAFAGVSEEHKRIVLSFRGTVGVSIENWIKNLQFLEVDFNYPGISGAKVHSGFYEDYNDLIAPQVAKRVLALRANYPDYQLAITGHSLGAALSVLSAMELHLKYKVSNIQIYNFGEPRVGNNVFANAFNKAFPNTKRLVHYNDAVPHLPPAWVGFQHIATEVWIQQNGTLKTCNGSGEDPACSDSVWGDSVEMHLSYLGVPLTSLCYA